MNRFEKTFFLIIISLINITTLGMPPVRHFGIREGLPSRQVYELQTDSSGFLWVYTLSGIVRYDGHDVRNYRLKDIDLSRDYTQAATTMGLSTEGDAVISIKTGQVYKYNPKLDDFTKIFDFDNHGLPDLRLYSVRFSGDEITFGTSDGIYREQNDTLLYHLLPGVPVFDVLESEKGIWYAATDRGIYPFIKSESGFDVKDVIKGSENYNFRTLSYSKDKLFAGSFSSGMYVYDVITGKFSKILADQKYLLMYRLLLSTLLLQ